MSGAKAHPHSECQNCGAALTGSYCAQCGQHDIEYHRSLGHFLEDSLEGFFHLDGKFLLSLRCLFTRPGFLTREFIGGRRVRYTNPLRFYIFASFLFFIVTALTEKVTFHVQPVKAGQAAGAHPGPAPSGFAAFKQRAGALLRPEVMLSPEFARESLHLLAEALVICIPLLALLLKLAYIRSQRVYVEHLIFALHLQTLYLFAILLAEVAGWALRPISGALASHLQSLWQLAILYLSFRAFRVFYQQSVGRTLVKMVAIGIPYYLIVALATVSAMLISASIVSHESLPPR